MMEHPDELELLAYVEEELPAAQRGVVAGHVGTCPACWARIRELETARSALREAPELHLPAERRHRLLDALGTGAGRRSYVSPMRLATILAPVAVILTIVGAIVTFDLGNNLGGGGDDSGSAGMAAEGDSAEQSGGGEDSAGGGGAAPEPSTELLAPTTRVLVRRVQGPPDRVVDLLRRRGFNAVVEGNTVVVGEAPGVQQALQDQPGGGVRVFVESTEPAG